MARSRRDDLEICMEILEILLTNDQPVSITEIAQKVGLRHQKAKILLDSMEKAHWITTTFANTDDLRFKYCYIILQEGNKIISFYHQRLEKLFRFLANPDK